MVDADEIYLWSMQMRFTCGPCRCDFDAGMVWSQRDMHDGDRLLF